MLRSAVVNVDGMITSIFELLRRVPYVETLSIYFFDGLTSLLR